MPKNIAMDSKGLANEAYVCWQAGVRPGHDHLISQIDVAQQQGSVATGCRYGLTTVAGGRRCEQDLEHWADQYAL